MNGVQLKGCRKKYRVVEKFPLGKFIPFKPGLRKNGSIKSPLGVVLDGHGIPGLNTYVNQPGGSKQV